MTGPQRPKRDSLAETRAVPVVDELAETREGDAITTTAVLLDAAEREIEERGFAATQMRHVGARAGVSLDICTAHYADMAAVLRALNERFIDQIQAAVDSGTATGSWRNARVREVVDIAVRTILEVIHDRRPLLRAFLTEGANDPLLVDGLRRIGAHFTERLVQAVSECIDAPVRERSVAFSLLVGVALAHHTALVGDDWLGIAISRTELAEETTRLITAYLAADVLETPS